jgi:hypothetical protein
MKQPNAPKPGRSSEMVMQHNSSNKPLARLKHSLWALSNPREIENNRNWNIKLRRHKWAKLGAA